MTQLTRYSWFIVGYAARVLIAVLPVLLFMAGLMALPANVPAIAWWLLWLAFWLQTIDVLRVGSGLASMARLAFGMYELWLFERAQKKAAERIGRKYRDLDFDARYDYHWRT